LPRPCPLCRRFLLLWGLEFAESPSQRVTAIARRVSKYPVTHNDTQEVKTDAGSDLYSNDKCIQREKPFASNVLSAREPLIMEFVAQIGWGNSAQGLWPK
jgi:hypothetical protein